MNSRNDGQEVELKLVLAPHDAPLLVRVPDVRRNLRGRARVRSLRAIYFDTPDSDLRKRMMALRVRREGRQWVQCLKSAGDSKGALSQRGEIETVVSGPRLDLAALADTEPGRLLPPDVAGRLAPAFETDIRRTSRRLEFDDGTAITLDLDLGRVISGDREDAVAEVELELTSGDPARVFELARKLLDHVTLRPSALSKAGRGYALLAGGGAPWSKAAVPRLDPAMTAEQALTRIIHACIDHLMANEPCATQGSHIEGIHQMRVATRRLRSALALFRKLLPAAQVAHLNGELRWLINEMGPARDWDVFLDETLPPVAAAVAGEDAVALDTLGRKARGIRDRAYEPARAAIASKRYAALFLDLGHWVESRGWRDQPLNENAARLFSPVADLAPSLLRKRYRAARRTGKGFESLSEEERHEVRISLKKLRYASEFLSSLYPERKVGPYAAALKTMQDDLGRMNDVAVMRHLLADLVREAGDGEARELERAAGTVVGWHEHLLRARDAEMVAAWKAFARTAPFWPESGGARR